MGDFPGHAVPATFFFAFGAFFLLLTLKRCCDLPPGATFCETHVPERNPALLRRVGLVLLILTFIGILFEGGSGALKDHIGFFYELAHQALYLCFTFVGTATYLESRQLVPPDSGRVCLSLAFLMNYVVWNEHGLMKDDMADRRIHLLQAQVNLAASVAFGYSVYRPDSVLAYVSGWGLMVLNATWLLTAGLNACCVDIMTHTVGAALCLEALLVATAILMGAAFATGGGCGGGGARRADGYGSLVSAAEEEAVKLESPLKEEEGGNLGRGGGSV